MQFKTSWMAYAAAGLVLALSSSSAAFAAGDVSSSTPSVADRLVNAKKAMDAKDWRNAGFELDQALHDAPRNADVYNLMGYYQRKKPNPDLAKAFENYNMALKINPRHKGAHEYIGEAFLMDKKPAEAQQHLAQLETICGNKTCEEYEDLAQAIARYKAANP